MKIDMATASRRQRYKILTSTVTPRPIAWVTTLSPSGTPNAAPFSFFNVMGDDPPVIALGFMPRRDQTLKDTAANIVGTGEFVVNLVSETQIAAMNETSREAGPGENELAMADVKTSPSARIAVPRITHAPVSFECLKMQDVWTSPHQVMIIGQVVFAHVADDVILDAEDLTIDTPALNLVARMHGSDWYARQTDLFQLTRLDSASIAPHSSYSRGHK